MIAIVDYGVGNLGSILNMLKRIGMPAKLVSTAEDLEAADKIILPGVGAFDHAMQKFNDSGMRETLDAKVLKQKTPLLGICVGMQMLTKGSEEGEIPGLGYIDAVAKKFPASSTLKVPHMGWNVVTPSGPSPFFQNTEEEVRFYFVHSYYVQVKNKKHSMLKCNYGLEYDAGIMKDNVYGAQFHPEKSHRFGKAFFSAFGAL